MKKIFAIALVAMMTMTANAQVYVGGGIGFQASKQGDDKTTLIKVMPEVGYNLDENWAVGIALGYGHTKNTEKINGVSTSVKTDIFEIAPYARLVKKIYNFA